MRYELFLRSSAPLTEETLAEIRRRVTEAGREPLVLEVFRAGQDRAEQAGITGVDLGAQVADLPDPSLLWRTAFDLATAHGLTVFDPQLSRTVTAGDAELIAERVAQTIAYAQAAPVTTPAPGVGGMSASTRIWLLVAALVGLALVISRALRCASGGE